MSLNTTKLCGSILSHAYVYELNIQLEKIAARTLLKTHGGDPQGKGGGDAITPKVNYIQRGAFLLSN